MRTKMRLNFGFLVLVLLATALPTVAAAQDYNIDPQAPWFEKLRFGSWGEMHYNAGEDDAPDKIDLHRVALEVAVPFNDWLRLYGETVLEHGLVSGAAGKTTGELTIQQLYVDWMLQRFLNLRLGRMLKPFGIVNRKHKPTLFNGVERPAFEEVMFPTSWFGDGLGVFGQVTDMLHYEMQLTSSLDGSQFNGVDGIRLGAQRQTPSLSQPSFTVRIDFVSPQTTQQGAAAGKSLRFGAAYFYGGLDNGNNGVNPGIDAELKIYNFDFEYRTGSLDLRGAWAYEWIDDALSIGANTANELQGYYLEAGWHVWPSLFRQGRLQQSDMILFVRHDDFDTQFDVSSTLISDPRGPRGEWTFGLSFYPVPQLVLKGDYQLRDDESAAGLPDQLNFGLGWAI